MRKTIGLSVIAGAVLLAAGASFAGSDAPKPIDTLTKWKKKVNRIAPERVSGRVRGVCVCPGNVNGVVHSAGFWNATPVKNNQNNDVLLVRCLIPSYDPATGEDTGITLTCDDGIPLTK